ncbi:MAG: mechanosensitive ion channel family protein [Robiginitomaculum sp.]|nr:mechanosensitive ion channel family protein [Robiginitomaculum sp.]
MEQSSRFAIVTVLGYMIFIVGVLIAFDKLGTQWSQLQWIVAALSVGIGLGLQAIFANFVSGLIILFERPVRIGDYITVGDISGTVTRIQIRATTLMDLDNKEILIPNQELVSQQVVNWTLGNSVTRLKVKVGIAYGSDTKIAHAVMLDTVKQNPNVLTNPEPTALFLGFGDSTLDFEIRVFLRDFVQRYIVSHELHMALDSALREAGIEIAFPQRDLHIKNLEDISPQNTKPKPKKKVSKKNTLKKKMT